MFSGVVQSLGKIVTCVRQTSHMEVTLRCHHDFYLPIQEGQWVCVDGVRFAVTERKGNDLLGLQAELAQCANTALAAAQSGSFVNLTCSINEPVDCDGHRLTGNIDFQAEICTIDVSGGQRTYQLSFPTEWQRYLVVGSRVALNGASVSIVSVDTNQSLFTVVLSDEICRMSIFEQKFAGDWLNIEIERGTQKVIETLRSTLSDTLGELYPTLDRLLALQGIDFEFLGARAKAKALDESVVKTK